MKHHGLGRWMGFLGISCGRHGVMPVSTAQVQISPLAPPGAAPHPSAPDERVRRLPLFQSLMNRPEFAAIAGAVLVFLLFGLSASGSGMFAVDGVFNWLQVAAYLGLLATGACLLMIGGEFDLSIGSMIGFAGMMVAIPATFFGWPVWLSILFAFSGSLALGWLNGYLVVRTGLPSFIVTLASMFVLRGLTLVMSIRFANSTIVSGIGRIVQEDAIASALFVGTVGESLFRWLAQLGLIGAHDNGDPLQLGIPKVILWWAAIFLVTAFVLARMRVGNWIFASGGDATAARNVGVPVNRTKIGLFMFTACCACLFATLQVCDIGSAAADRGIQKEFEAIIAAVIGGSLLTGGYGSIIGASIGALIFGVVQIGITYTNIDSDWFRVFLGLMLLLAVLFNNYIRRRVTAAK